LLHLTFDRDDPEGQAESEGWIEYYRKYISPDVDPFQPIMDIVYPIVDDVSQIELTASDHYNPNTHTVVGLVAVNVYWREIFSNALPPGLYGVVVVVDNACTDSFSYQINGPNVVYLGVFDKHNSDYDYLVLSANVTDLDVFGFHKSEYTGAPLDQNVCPYTIRLYPSDDMKDAFTTNNALIFTIVTLLSFAVLAVIFATYDFKVERRQKKVLSSAVRSSEIVSSLFPTSVHDQLYPTLVSSDKRTMRMWPIQEEHENRESVTTVGGPIAKLYPETTVMFADIKGFTQWSDSREPTQVFQLLEALYGAFDQLAKLYGVFKVETIGDTYVAVVGLPTSRKNHAVVMAKFAKKCLEKMAVLTQELEEVLGLVREVFVLPYLHFIQLKKTTQPYVRLVRHITGYFRPISSYRIEFWPNYSWCLARRKSTIPVVW
jgi:Adenylate and Guanylate cyclase catalytic domain